MSAPERAVCLGIAAGQLRRARDVLDGKAFRADSSGKVGRTSSPARRRQVALEHMASAAAWLLTL